MQLELRQVVLFGADDTELRVGEGEMPHRFVGLIPFNSLSSDLGGFKERLSPLAFRTTMSGGADVRALVDHDSGKLLGRTSNGTLRMAETEKGLAVEIDVPNTSYGNDIRELVRRRDIRGMSFGFKVREGGQRFSKEAGQTIRELTDVDLREVSVVGSPAYPETSVAVRSAEVDAEVSAFLRGQNIFPRMLTAKLKLLSTII